MSSPHYASVAARLLRRAPLPSPPAAAANERALATIQLALAARRRKQRLARAAAAVVLVAASVAVVFGLRSSWPSLVARSGEAPQVSVRILGGSGASVVDAAQHRATLRAGTEVVAGSRIETTADGGAALRLSTGTELALDGKSGLMLQGSGPLQHFVLESGGLQAKVAKLAVGARFVVQTPDAEVEVRGTKFHLSVLAEPEACAPARTRLAVQEGTVEVRWSGQAVQIRAGQHWPAACGATEGSDGMPSAPTSGAAKHEARTTPSPRKITAVAPPAVPSSAPAAAMAQERNRSALAAQTELFAEASRAARRADVAAALAKYQELVQTYPGSALAENALVERMRLLQGSAAKREAGRYLELYPSGFGKTEAERILVAP